MRVNGQICYLWRAVDHEGEVLDAIVTKHRNRHAATAVLRRLLKRFGPANTIVTDKLKSYGAAINGLGVTAVYETSRWKNNRAENSHQPFRKRERAMQRFRSIASLQRFVAIHRQVHNHFNLERHLVSRSEFCRRRNQALAEWRLIAD